MINKTKRTLVQLTNQSPLSLITGAIKPFYMARLRKSGRMAYLVDELSYVSGMGCGRADGIVGLRVHRSLVQPANPDGLDHVWLQSIGLLQLAQIIVLKNHR